MSTVHLIAIGMAVALGLYLIVALLKPEWFA